MNKKNGTHTSSFGTSGRINHDSTKFYNSKLYSEIEIVESKNKNENIVDKKNTNIIYNTSSEKMYQLEDNSIHLMITSPPYNVTKEYDKDLSLKEYLSFLKTVFTETYRVLVDGGRACVNVANLGRRPYIPLSDYISQMMNEIGFNMRGEIIWNKAASASPSTAWGSCLSATNPILRDVHEYILIFSKGELKRDSTNKENSITKEQFMEWTKSIWTMNAESAKRVGHPAPFPEELPKRLIHLYSFKGDIILDPFIGSGTTAIAAVKAERKYIGYETDIKYIELAESRLDHFLKQGELFTKTT